MVSILWVSCCPLLDQLPFVNITIQKHWFIKYSKEGKKNTWFCDWTVTVHLTFTKDWKSVQGPHKNHYTRTCVCVCVCLRKAISRSQSIGEKKNQLLRERHRASVCVHVLVIVKRVHVRLCTFCNFSIWRLINAWSESYRTANQRQ